MKLLVSLLIAFATLTHSLPLQDQKTDIAKTSFDLSSDTVDLSLPNEEPVLTRNRRRTKSRKGKKRNRSKKRNKNRNRSRRRKKERKKKPRKKPHTIKWTVYDRQRVLSTLSRKPRKNGRKSHSRQNTSNFGSHSFRGLDRVTARGKMKNRRNMIEVAERLRKRNENSTPMGNENQYPFGRDPNYQNPCFGSSLDTLSHTGFGCTNLM